MNKVTLSLVALATLGGAAQVQAADLTPEEQKAEAIKAKKAAIDEVRKVLNAASIEIEKECVDKGFPGVKDPFLLELSNLTKELNVIYDKDETLEFSEAEQASYKGKIGDVKKRAFAKLNLEIAKATLDKKYDTLKGVYDAKIAETGNYPNVGPKYKTTLQGYGVENVKAEIDAAYKSGKIEKGTQTQIEGKINTLSKKINNLMAGIKKAETDYNNNEASYKNVIADFNAAKTAYDAQLQDVIKALPTPTYEKWQKDVVKDLNAQYRLLLEAKKKIEAAYAAGEAAKQAADLQGIIAGAKGEIQTLVVNKMKEAEVEDKAKATADAQVESLQKYLDGEKAKLAKYKLTDCDAGIAAAQKQIDDMQKDIDYHYANGQNDVSKQDYVTMEGKINTAIGTIKSGDQYKKSVDQVVANKEAQIAMDAEVKTLEEALAAAIEKAKTPSEDKYNAAAYFQASVDAINKNITKAKNGIAGQFGVKEAVSYQNSKAYKDLKNAINKGITDYGTRTDKSLVAYNKAVKTATDAQALLEKLVEKAKDTTVTVDGTTYGNKIAQIRKDIDAINMAVKNAKAKKDDAHRQAMENAAKKTISEDIAKLTTDYDANKLSFDKSNAEKSAQAHIQSAQDLISAESAVLDAIGDPTTSEFTEKYGNQAGDISTELAKLQVELDKLTIEKKDAESKYNSDKAAAGADEAKLLTAAATAIEVLSKINLGLNNLEGQVDNLDKLATAAKENVKAYKETIKEVNTTSAAQTKLETLRSDLKRITVNPAWTYYDNAMAQYIIDLTEVAQKTEDAYAAHTSKARKDELLGEKETILANAQALANKVLPNQNAYTAQTVTIANVKKEWQAAYDKVSNNDWSDKGPDFLSQLAKQQEVINKLAKDAETEFGKGAADENQTAFNDAIKGIRTQLDEITGKSKTDYAKNVNEQNAAHHAAFESAFKLSSDAFSKSVTELNQFRTIQREELRENALETNQLVKVHEDIYAYAEMLRQLKKAEQDKYDGFVAMDKAYGADNVFFNAGDYIKDAKKYKAAIETLLKDYEDKVNAYAKGLINNDLAYAQSKLNAGQAAIAAFTYTGKSKAFNDLETLIASVNTGINNGGTFAVQVDKQWLGDLAKANVDKMYYADIEAACIAEKAALIAAVTKIYEDEKVKIGELPEIDTDQILKDLDVHKAGTIDVNKDIVPSLATVPTINRNCGAYIGTILANHSDVYANAVQASKNIVANNKAYEEITKNLEAADAVLANAYKKFSQLYSLHMKNAATDALRQIELDYYAQVALANTYNEGQACDAHKGEFKDLDKKFQAKVDGMKNSLIDVEIADVRTKIDQVKEEYNLAAAKLGLANVTQYNVEGLYTTLKGIEDNWNLPTSDKKKKSYDTILNELLGHEATVANMYKTLNGLYDNTKVAETTADIDALKATVDKKLTEAEAKANYNEILTGKYHKLVELLRTKYNSTVANYEAKQKENHLLFFKENFAFDFGVVNEALDGARVAALVADYNLYHNNDLAFDKLNEGLAELNTLHTAFQEHIKDFVSVEETAKAAEFARQARSIAATKADIEAAHKAVALPSSTLTDDVAWVKNSILTIQKSWTNSEVPVRLSAVLTDLDAAHTSMTGKNYSPSTKAELNKTYGDITDLLYAVNSYNDDAVDGIIAKDIYGKPLKKAEVIDYLKQAWPLMVEQINTLAKATKAFAERTDEAAYIKGDACHDGNVNVNDYDLVRSWILKAKSFDSVVNELGEGAAYGGDMNEDKTFDVGDMTRISNLIFRGSENGETTTRARATRSVEGDQITIAKQAEETTVFGKTVQIAVNVTNNASFTAGQFDVTLPAGMKLVGQELTGRSNGHEIFGSELSEGKYRILAATIENTAFVGHEGALVVLNVEVGSDYTGGTVEVNNAIFSDADGRSYVITRGIGDSTGETTGIDSITAPTMKERIFSIGGMVKKSVQKGINIIVGEDGTTRKVIKK